MNLGAARQAWRVGRERSPQSGEVLDRDTNCSPPPPAREIPGSGLGKPPACAGTEGMLYLERGLACPGRLDRTARLLQRQGASPTPRHGNRPETRSLDSSDPRLARVRKSRSAPGNRSGANRSQAGTEEISSSC